MAANNLRGGNDRGLLSVLLARFSAFGDALAHNRVLGKALCLKVCGVKGFFRRMALAAVFQPISGIDVIVRCGISRFNGINHFCKNRIHRHSPSLSS
jgi:hypothetical protein